MLKKRWLWIVIGVVVLAGGGYFAYTRWFAPEEVVTETVMQTGTVTRGDLSITAAGTGMLVASSEIDLEFSASGTLEELLVEVGDEVNAGDVLGWIDDADAQQVVASAELSVIQAEMDLALAQAEAELAVAQAQADLDTAQEALDELVNWEPDEEEIELAEIDVTSAQASYQTTVAKAGIDQTASARISLDQAIASLADAQENYANAMSPDRDWESNIEDTRESAAESLVKEQQDLEIAQASYELDMISTTYADIQSAKASVMTAESALEELQTAPEEAEVTAAQIAVQQMTLVLEQAKLNLSDVGDGKTAATREAELALEQAQLNLATVQEDLDGTMLIAPFAGTVTAVNAEVGETVNGTVVVLSDLVTPVVQFWVEESDLSSVAEGHAVRIVFEALPDYTYEGEIYRVDPILVTVSNTSAVQIWATIDTTAHPVNLLGDMNVEVEIVAGEALNALLVPVQALRQMGEQYTLFVVGADGELEMRIVEVGLMDFVNAEIISGVELGEVVSLGETTTSTSSSSESSSSEAAAPAMMPGMGMMGGGRP